MTVLAPEFSTLSFPTMPSLSFSEEEQRLIALMQRNIVRDQWHMRVAEAYYLGEQHIQNLRIAIPAELEFLRTIVGWASLAVDPYVERLHVDGFRLPNATDADEELSDLWTGNGLDAEFPLGVTDALSLKSCYWFVGSPADGGDLPLVTIESPLNVGVLWDLRGTTPKAAMQQYWEGDRRHASLLVPGKTTHMATDDNGQWVVVDRDEHDFDFVPVVRMANQPRTSARDGRSAITPAIRSTIDSACRDLLGLEVSREFYSAPKMTLLGAAEADFQKADGTPKTQWESLISKYNAIERDEDGNLPQIHQMTAYDPSVLIKPLEFRASQMASLVAAPPQDLGLYTQGNPTSADAAEVAERRRNRRAKLQQATFGPRVVEVMQMQLRFMNDGVLPDKFKRMETDWREVNDISMSMASDALQKQVSVGMVPPTSDVTLSKAGYSAVERRRLAADRANDPGTAFLDEVASSLTAKDAKVLNSLDKAISAPAPVVPKPGPGLFPTKPEN